MTSPAIHSRRRTHSGTRNACKLCAPLGASMVFKGMEDTIPLLHGSQGCATYIRRYVIGHFREPIDIASSNFSEETTVFGGERNLGIALDNLIHQYNPKAVGIATTCLSETIGEDVGAYIKRYISKKDLSVLPQLISVSTPSYAGSHSEGFRKTIHAVVTQLAEKQEPRAACGLALFSALLSPADLRHLKQLCNEFCLPVTLFPDYSDTLDGGSWETYHPLPPGGTSLESLRALPSVKGSVELGLAVPDAYSAGAYLNAQYQRPHHSLPIPLGIRQTDALLDILSLVSGNAIPLSLKAQRARLVDAYVDGHKYVSGKTAILFGDADMIQAAAAFLDEIGVRVLACLTGAPAPGLVKGLTDVMVNQSEPVDLYEDNDFETLQVLATEHQPNLLIGHSKGYTVARQLRIPLIRMGFPVHDRFGAQRLLHVGYKGTQQFFDNIVNVCIEAAQESNSVGYLTY